MLSSAADASPETGSSSQGPQNTRNLEKYSDWFQAAPPAADRTNFDRSPNDPLRPQQKKSWSLCCPEQADQAEFPRVSSCASFGDNGTTASVNAYGNLIQLTRYLAAGRSGFFAVNSKRTPEPYIVPWRIKYLLDDLNHAESGIGLRLCSKPEVPTPKLDFVFDRWPRFTTKMSGLKIECQYAVKDGTIIQHYSIEREETSSSHSLPHMVIDVANLSIIDCEGKAFFNQYNSRFDSYHMVEGLDSLGFIVAHEFPPGYHESVQCTNVHNASRRPSISEEEVVDVVQNGENGTPSADPDHPGRSEAGSNDGRSMHGQSAKGDGETGHDNQKASDQAKARKPSAVGVIMSLFINDQAVSTRQYFPKPAGSGSKIDLESLLSATNTVRITMAYRLQLLSSSANHWESSVITASQASIADAMTASYVPELKLSSSPKLDFVLRRNLQHILAVCSIETSDHPIWGSQGRETPSRKVDSEKEEGKAIALTCGDLSGHHIVTSASFFAFRFLLAMFTHLKGIAGSGLLRECIFEVCKGHLIWTFTKALPKTLVMDETWSGCAEHKDTWSPVSDENEIKGFQSEYWISGDAIGFSEHSRNAPSTSLTNTPFQFIKAGEFHRTFDKYKEGFDSAEISRRHVSGLITTWVFILYQMDRRGNYTFSRPTEDGIGRYRLDDHIWIWTAAKSIEDLGLAKKLKPLMFRGQKEIVLRSFTPGELQVNILRRFTTENIVLQKSMLATTRSAQETRFLFHSRDTSLFYAMEEGFFDAGSRSPLWESTMDFQKQHTYNNMGKWDNPLRYALALIMAAKGKQLKMEPKQHWESFNEAADILYRSCLPTGVFAGELDGTTKKPRVLSNRRHHNFYWHVGFEIPLIFWEYARAFPMDPPPPQKDQERLDKAHDAGHNSTESTAIPISNNEKVATGFQTSSQGLFSGPDMPFGRSKDLQLSSNSLKKMKAIPMRYTINQGSDLELVDEWLYKYPDFLDFHPSIRLEDEQYAENVRESLDENSVLGKLLESKDNGDGLQCVLREEDFDEKAAILDVRRTAHTRRGISKHDWEDRLPLCSNYFLKFFLNQYRTAEDAKKRLVWMPRGDRCTALLSYLATCGSQRESISEFFNRHASWQKYFHDDTAAAKNFWETEFHLSFYQLVEQGVPEIRGKKISRATMGFRFVGDFWDRYWTCHIVDYLLAKSDEDYYWGPFDQHQPLSPIQHKSLRNDSMDYWKQRRILELVLFDRMLDEITRSVKGIVDEIKHELGVRKDTFTFSTTVPSDSNSLMSSRQWMETDEILHAMEEDLNAIMDEAQNWKNREEERGVEQPRWSKKDEHKYRRTISKIVACNQRNLRELDSFLKSIQSWRSSLQSRRQTKLDEINFQNAEDVRFFTYVTVVFLPLGFAASIFSMSETPAVPVLVSMIVTAVVALCLTIVALVSAKPMVKMIRVVSREIKDFPVRLAQRSILVETYRRERLAETTQTAVGTPRTERRLERLHKQLSHIRLRATYIVLELPIRHMVNNAIFTSMETTKSEDQEQSSSKKAPKMVSGTQENAGGEHTAYESDPQAEAQQLSLRTRPMMICMGLVLYVTKKTSKGAWKVLHFVVKCFTLLLWLLTFAFFYVLYVMLIGVWDLFRAAPEKKVDSTAVKGPAHGDPTGSTAAEQNERLKTRRFLMSALNFRPVAWLKSWSFSSLKETMRTSEESAKEWISQRRKRQ
ncbi:mg2+ transporter zinc transport protein [Diplodia corticola]|uniref:Mg2+ transporter zinc transport protein n=1 Tax=Diplodia corticola TaxID=236234 RepID=A0A1J9RT89_9PEZI|nr:mg2+ transporter zinc transport protein [Diplodia corticola]OJD31647.1 mg2+ transporter zinc transport protein [Diplodia corticola]